MTFTYGETAVCMCSRLSPWRHIRTCMNAAVPLVLARACAGFRMRFRIFESLWYRTVTFQARAIAKIRLHLEFNVGDGQAHISRRRTLVGVLQLLKLQCGSLVWLWIAATPSGTVSECCVCCVKAKEVVGVSDVHFLMKELCGLLCD